MRNEPPRELSEFGRTDSGPAQCLRNSESTPMPWFRGMAQGFGTPLMEELKGGITQTGNRFRFAIFQTSGVLENEDMIRAYIVEHDIGFAPNPFHGVCTLATCKPEIRWHTAVGDWVVGVGSVADGIRGRMVFAMQVEETLSFDQYWNDKRFQMKKPNFSGSLKQAQGDNVYHQENGVWVQERSRHTHTDPEMTAKHKQRDTKRNRVLISKRFVYYGADAIELPQYLEDSNGCRVCLDGSGTPHGQLQRSRNFIDSELTERFVNWLESVDQWDCIGEPCEWRKQNSIKRMLAEQTFANLLQE